MMTNTRLMTHGVCSCALCLGAPPAMYTRVNNEGEPVRAFTIDDEGDDDSDDDALRSLRSVRVVDSAAEGSGAGSMLELSSSTPDPRPATGAEDAAAAGGDDDCAERPINRMAVGLTFSIVLCTAIALSADTPLLPPLAQSFGLREVHRTVRLFFTHSSVCMRVLCVCLRVASAAE